ncbi:C4-dicarboxylate transport sensor protein DctB [Achromobacter xylosoxidans A8]|uniref:C4-dicarboxylate transport sensor protein DctB n=1 Tax=Achromobacter xylosoxidans (strain A8) TaxID=762376 RepID=E3HHP6_ACHXA|nr:ATP-binding protein [Achromobacter xylosoxidans]ADP15426.1 C4-dicarboxylate transport sensor protein DctB [Achromobacter xylosoxidans A8]
MSARSSSRSTGSAPDQAKRPARFPPARAWSWPWRAAAILLGIAIVFGVLHAATLWAREGALKNAAAQARGTAQINAALLRNNLDKFRALPFVLTRDVDVRAALLGGSRGQIESLDEKLDTLSRGVGASAIYVLDKKGLAIAASNWREPATFVGVDYQFRPYFQGAIARGSAEHFALGTISHEAGLYLSRRVDDANGAMLGVVVLKVDFRDLEADWRQSNAPIFVTDEHGVVLLGSISDWRFDVLAPLSPTLARTLRTSLQFGDALFQPLPLKPPLQPVSSGQLVRADATLPQIPAGAPLLHTTLPIVESPGWTLHLLSPVQAAINQATANAQLGALLAQSALAAIAGLVLFRRHRNRERAEQQAAIHEQLASLVDERTSQLLRVNEQLVDQMDERQRTAARLHTMQEELVQASKLALLGQVAAGVAHEINQPVAAIRAYADNAAEFLRRQDNGSAQENLGTIAALTDRIGHITGELRAFSRKAGASVGPTSLKDCLEGALLLVAPRARRQGIVLQRPPEDLNYQVLANRVRLEQVLVNLLQNAMDALEGLPDGRIVVALQDLGATVQIYVSDNGPGLSPAARAHLFTPFHTTKPEGLGLGLVICRDIVVEFGGDLIAAGPSDPAFPAPHAPGSGAMFILTLRKARDQNNPTSLHHAPRT